MIKILIPLDGTPFSRQILPVVHEMFDAQRYTILLLRVEQPPEMISAMPPRTVAIGWPLPLYTSEADIERARHPIYRNQLHAGITAQLLTEMQADIEQLSQAGFTVEALVSFGNPVEEIVETIQQHGIGLLAMVTHGREGLNRLFFGSVAEEVLHQISIPILLLRAEEHVTENQYSFES